jgi:hypothetical protein
MGNTVDNPTLSEVPKSNPGSGASTRTSLVTAASVLFYSDALAWGVGVVPSLYYAFTYKALPTIFGIRLMGGPFESLGIDALMVAGIVFVVVSAFKVLAAFWLWNNRIDGAVLGLVLMWPSAIFWYGFALPLGPLIGIGEVVLLIVVWRTLDR